MWIESAVERLLRWCRDAPGGSATAQVRAAQGAFLLHTHAALAGPELGLRTQDHEEHVNAALRLLRWFRGQWQLGPGTWPPESQGLRPRDFYLALASAEFLVARYDSTGDLAKESLRSEGPDGWMCLLAGCALETKALARRQSEGRWHDGTLREAERRFREALEDDPTLVEARLRLGWVLVRRGQPGEARPLLEAVATTAPTPDRRALAWLFLARAHETLEDVPSAVGAYRRAVAIAPQLQAAQLGLAHAMEQSAGDEAARATIVPFFLERSRSWVRADPWSEYPFGPPELRYRAFEALRERLCAP